MLRSTFVLLLLSTTAACAARARGMHERELIAHRFAFGVLGGVTLDVRDVCPSGRVRQVRVSRTFLDYVASFGTLGLYLPHRVQLQCAVPDSP